VLSRYVVSKFIVTGVLRRCTYLLELACASVIGATASLSATSAAAQATSESPAHNIPEVQRALASCVAPLVKEAHQEIRIAARIGFNARGQPLGPPHFTYVTPDVPDRMKDEYKNAVSDALRRCTPLSFSPELAGLIAGVPLILIFDERGLVRARVGSSSAYVAPVPLPSSEMPPVAPVPLLPRPPTPQEPPIWVPGLASPANPIPSLPHGPETSQDRRSRCMFQSGRYGVPLTSFTQYMGLCTQ
jgi:hypothetical protein